MNKIFILLFIVLSMNNIFASSNTSKDDLHLVLGSSRKKASVSVWYERMTNTDNQDFSHQKTFNGQATTLDIINPSKDVSHLPYICCNAKKYKPASNQVIRNVFFELFPSIQINTLGITIDNSPEERWNTLMLMPDVIKNLSKYMTKGSTLEIEHHPHSSSLDPQMYAEGSTVLREENPFHCFLSPLFMENFGAIPHLGVNSKVAYWKSIQAELIKKRGWREDIAGHIIHEAVTQDHPKILETIAMLASLINISEENIKKLIAREVSTFQSQIEETNDIAKAYQAIGVENSLSLFIAHECSMLRQKPLIVKFLQKYGFENVEITHKDNPYNGRKNVLMISAIRNGNPFAADENNKTK